MRSIVCITLFLFSSHASSNCPLPLSNGNYEKIIKKAQSDIAQDNASYEMYICLSRAYQHSGRFQDAIHYLYKTIDLATTEHEKNDIYFDLSVALKYVGDLDKSLNYIDKKLAYDRRQNQPGDMGVSLATKAAILGDMGRNKEAIALSTKSIQYLERDTDRASTYNNIATSHSALGDFKNAFKYVELAIAIDRRRSSAGRIDLAIHLMNKGYLYRKQGKYTAALITIDQSLNIVEEQNNQYWQMSGLIHRAKIHELSQHPDKALADFQEAAKLARDIKAQELEYLLSAVRRLEQQSKTSKEKRKLVSQFSR